MPAVIDTGGPRVLHRVERVEPSSLTRSTSRLVQRISAASSSSGSESAAVKTILSDEPIGESSLPISLEFPADRGLRLRDRKRCDAVERRWIKRRERKRQAITEVDDVADSSSATETSGGRYDRRCLSIGSEETEPSAVIGRHLRHHSCLDRTANEARASPIVTRLFGDDEASRLKDLVVVDGISSQRVLNCTKYEWRCFSAIPDGLVSAKSEEETERATRERRKHRETRKTRASYLQLAMMLFLVAFGNPVRTNLATFGGGRNTGVGAGLGLLGTIGTIVGAVKATPVDIDAGVRAERSANLSHISGASRKIQMYIKNRHLQILRDGTVNGSTDDTSEYTIFQRTSVSRGQLRIQGVATCLYLCMDSCGLLYGSREYTEECVFNETLEQHNYNTYSSVRWSTPKKSLYLGLNRRGQPRRVQARGHNLGRLSAYARVLTQVAPAERVEALQARMLGAQHAVRHHHNSNHHHHQHHNNNRNKHQAQSPPPQQQQQPICPTLPPQEKDGRDKFRCRKRKKRKKWKRRCADGEKPGPHCAILENSHGRANGAVANKSQSPPGDISGGPESKRSCEGEASEELCRKQALDAPAKKRKSRIDGPAKSAGTKQLSKRRKETRARKTEDASNGDGNPRAESPVNRKKRPNSARQRSSSAKKRITGRPTRTTASNVSSSLAVTLPSTWYPTTSATALPTEVSSWWPMRSKSTLPAIRNSVTGLSAKDIREHGISLLSDKTLDIDDIPETFFDKTSTTASTYSTSVDEPRSSVEDRSIVTSLANDWSGEASDEVKSEESTFAQDDNDTTPNYYGEYSTLVPTMDTIPPQTTEDYTRAIAAKAAISPLEYERDHRPTGQTYEGLAM